MADPVSTCVHEIFELSPVHLPRLVTKLKNTAAAFFIPGITSFCTVEYLT